MRQISYRLRAYQPKKICTPVTQQLVALNPFSGWTVWLRVHWEKLCRGDYLVQHAMVKCCAIMERGLSVNFERGCIIKWQIVPRGNGCGDYVANNGVETLFGLMVWERR